MNPIKTLAAAAMAVAMSSDIVTAWSASVKFYDDAFFSGEWYNVDFTDNDSNRCLTFGCHADVASSARWSGIPRSNAIGGPIHIQFYSDAECRGVMRRWKSTDEPPNNFQVDGINDQISSFVVTEIYNSVYRQHQLTCTKSMMVESGPTSDVSVVNATEFAHQKANATAPHVLN